MGCLDLVGSVDDNGHYKYIRDRRRAAGWMITYRGRWHHSTRAHLMLDNAGTDDCIRNLDAGNAGNRTKTGNRTKALVDYLLSSLPGTTILLSTCPPLGSMANFHGYASSVIDTLIAQLPI
ncbi:hypothetical protein B0T24DRAFT_677132 [Lasiosphaeria ovina]|uniref:Uncharacterized protein n=1 Tax=Lasiosphaeria ovina TaxID=92902 RepID=A0AAE0NAH8_9PEZI|nr:hypothetical protein B0T24DRAFT_677132 [Lasiosphaeria ovina]